MISDVTKSRDSTGRLWRRGPALVVGGCGPLSRIGLGGRKDQALPSDPSPYDSFGGHSWAADKKVDHVLPWRPGKDIFFRLPIEADRSMREGADDLLCEPTTFCRLDTTS